LIWLYYKFEIINNSLFTNVILIDEYGILIREIGTSIGPLCLG
jgi:hypothetical protein